MSETLTTTRSEISLAEAQRRLGQLWRENPNLKIEVASEKGTLTLTQNKAMHLFFGWLAEELNNAGYDMRRTLRNDIEVPWNKDSVKEYLWRPIQEALTQKRSTQDINKVQPTEIHDVLSRHLAQRLGVVCPPWPKREDKAA